MTLTKDFPAHWTKANWDAHFDAHERDAMGWPCHGCAFTDPKVPHTHNCTKRDKKA